MNNMDTWNHILTKCNYSDIRNIALTCKWLNEIIKSGRYIFYLPIKNKMEIFYYACKYNKINIVKLIMEDSRVDPSSRQNIFLKWACTFDRIEIVEILVESGQVYPPFQIHLPSLGFLGISKKVCVEIAKILGKYDSSYKKLLP